MTVFLHMLHLELRRALRDANTLLYIGFPVFAYPFMFWAGIEGLIYVQQAHERETWLVAVEAPALVEVLDSPPVRAVPGTLVDLDAGRLDALVDLDAEGAVRIHHRAGSARSRAATEAVEEALAEHRTDLRTKAAERLGVPLYTLRSEATDDPSRQLMWFLALLIGMLAPATLVISATYPTIELFVVERDKGTLETLMTSAVDRVKLVGARMIVAAGLAWVASMANVLALGLTLWHGAYLVVERLQDVPFVLSPSFLAVPPVLAGGALVTTTVLAVLFSVARTFREAQMIFSAAAFVLLAPSMVSVFACMEDFSRDLAPWPLFHTSTLAFDALRGQLVATDLLVGLATDGLAVAVLLGGWHVVFGLDRLVTGIGRPAWVDRLTGET